MLVSITIGSLWRSVKPSQQALIKMATQNEIKITRAVGRIKDMVDGYYPHRDNLKIAVEIYESLYLRYINPSYENPNNETIDFCCGLPQSQCRCQED